MKHLFLLAFILVIVKSAYTANQNFESMFVFEDGRDCGPKRFKTAESCEKMGSNFLVYGGGWRFYCFDIGDE